MNQEIKQIVKSILIRTIISFFILTFGVILALSLFQQPGRALPQSQFQSSTPTAVEKRYNLTEEGLFVREGQSWQKLENLPEHPLSMAVAPTNPDLLYIGTVSTGFYRSQDGGRHWQLISPEAWSPPGVALRGTAIAIDEQDSEHIAVATAYSIGKQLTGGPVYETHNAGQTWRERGNPEEIIEQLLIEEGVILAQTEDGQITFDAPSNEPRPFINPTARENPY